MKGQPDCAWVVDVMSDYLTDALETADRRAFEGHVTVCPPCRGYLAQMRVMLGAAARIELEGLSPDVAGTMKERFRSWARARGER
jgi:hypothetical protein